MGIALARKQAHFIPRTLIYYDKGGSIKRAGCLVTGCQIKMASRSHSSRPMASPMPSNAILDVSNFCGVQIC